MSTSWLNKAEFSVIWMHVNIAQWLPWLTKMMIDSVYICGVCLSECIANLHYE